MYSSNFWLFDDIIYEKDVLLPYKNLDGIKVSSYYTSEGIANLKCFKFRDTDICVSSYGRSGSHWLVYIVALMLYGGELPEGKALSEVAIFLGQVKNAANLENMEDPRIFHEHLPFQYLMSDPKVKHIYLARNPKETAVSWYNFLKSNEKHNPDTLQRFSGNWDEFFEHFAQGEFWFGSWFDHVSTWWKHRNDENVLFLWYEDLQQNGNLVKIAEFLGVVLEPQLLEKIREKTSFSRMSQNDDAKIANTTELPKDVFFRSGTNQTWKQTISSEQQEIIDKLLENTFSPNDLACIPSFK